MAMHDLAYSRGLTLIDYGRETEEEIARLQGLICSHQEIAGRYPPRWLAIKLLEEDRDIVPKVRAEPGGDEIMEAAAQSVGHLSDIYGDDAETIIADRRYGFISGLVREVVTRPKTSRQNVSDIIDMVVTSRPLGIPIFIAAMWVVFQMTADVSSFYVGWIDGVIGGPLTRWVIWLLGVLGQGGGWLESLLVDGVITGVGGVLVFVPVLMFLYFFIAVLEDSGYMARAAFVMDKLMHVLGLHGKSFIPMLIGFGCNVPAIYATRTLENRRDRLMTGMLVPLMSCGARLPVYVIFAAAFFPARSGEVIFTLYLAGIVLAIGMGMLFRRTILSDESESLFVMELPPYRFPTFKGLAIHTWEHTSAFVRKAWTVILGMSVVLWFLMHLPWGVSDVKESLFGRFGSVIAPVFAPAGFDDWEPAGSLVTGIVAKEVIVSTMSQAYAVDAREEGEPTGATPGFFEDVGWMAVTFWEATVNTVKGAVSILPGVDLLPEAEDEAEETALTSALRQSFSPLSAFAFCLFVLIYTPCMVTLISMWQEYGARWALFNAAYLLTLAWVVSVVAYQGGRLMGFG